MHDWWNIKQLARELESSFAQCRGEFERSMWRVITAKEIRGVVGDRRLSPAEQAILCKYGLVL